MEIREQTIFVLSGQSGDETRTYFPAVRSEITNIFNSLRVGSRRKHFAIMRRITDFKLDDVSRCARRLKFGVESWVQRSQTNADAEVRFATKCFDERNNNFADGDRIFADCRGASRNRSSFPGRNLKSRRLREGKRDDQIVLTLHLQRVHVAGSGHRRGNSGCGCRE